MSERDLEFRGATVGPDGATTDHVAIVREPEEDSAAPGWSCIVRCPSLMPRDEKISGASAAQALGLAKLFVLDLLEQHGVTIAAAHREH